MNIKTIPKNQHKKLLSTLYLTNKKYKVDLALSREETEKILADYLNKNLINSKETREAVRHQLLKMTNGDTVESILKNYTCSILLNINNDKIFTTLLGHGDSYTIEQYTLHGKYYAENHYGYDVRIVDPQDGLKYIIDELPVEVEKIHSFFGKVEKRPSV